MPQSQIAAAIEPTGAAAGRMANEFLTFKLGSEEYGIEILKVQEIRSYEAVTRIANAPEFIKGVVNLRGIIVPIVDMRIKFNLEKADYDQFTVVIILSVISPAKAGARPAPAKAAAAFGGKAKTGTDGEWSEF